MDVAKLIFLRSKPVLFGRQVLHKSLMSSYNIRLLNGRHSIGHNGSRLCVVADLDALHCQPTKMLIRCTKLQFCTEPAITQNRCCAFVVLFCPLYSRSILLLLGSHTLCQVLVCVSARATWQCVWLVGWF